MTVHVPGPLASIRVLDLSSVVMGPYATQQLGDLGADVIAVESASGDINRSIGAGPVAGLSGVALNLMRNKRSICLDLKDERGRQAALDLAATCDVLITNLRPGPLGRLRLTYDDVRLVRPDIVFCQAHGFASDSDLADAPAYDDIIQSAVGIPDLFVKSGHEPMLLPTLVADKVCGMTIVSSVLAALVHRGVSGEGQFIEVPMFDAIRSFLLVEHGAGSIPEPKMAESGHIRILTPWRRPQATADGWIHVLPYNGEHYERIFRAGGRPDLADDDTRFGSRAARFTHSDSLYRDLFELMPSKSSKEWLAFCDEEGIPATVVGTIDELIDALPLAEHPVAGTYRQIPHGVRFSQTPASVRTAAPTLGQDGSAVLAEIGYTAAAIAETLDGRA